MAKVSKQIQQLFLRLLNFTPELLANIQQEAKLQNTSFDAIIRAAVEKHLRDLTVARPTADHVNSNPLPVENYARLVLRAHFEEDRNEFLTEAAIRAIGAPKHRLL